MRKMLRRSIYIYRLLLYVYPRTFREMYGDDMVYIFAQSLHEKQKEGWVSVARFWWHILTDLFISAIEEHLQTLQLPKLPIHQGGNILKFKQTPLLLILSKGIAIIILMLLFFVLNLAWNIVVDPSGYGGASGTFQNTIEKLGQMPQALLPTLLILIYSTVMLLRARTIRQVFTLCLIYGLIGPILFVGIMAMIRFVAWIFPPDETTYIGMIHHHPLVYVTVFLTYVLLMLAFIKLQRNVVTLKKV